MDERVADILFIKRNMKVKVCCIFCERRIGWMSLEQIANHLNDNQGICCCEQCSVRFMGKRRWDNTIKVSPPVC